MFQTGCTLMVSDSSDSRDQEPFVPRIVGWAAALNRRRAGGLPRRALARFAWPAIGRRWTQFAEDTIAKYAAFGRFVPATPEDRLAYPALSWLSLAPWWWVEPRLEDHVALANRAAVMERSAVEVPRRTLALATVQQRRTVREHPAEPALSRRRAPAQPAAPINRLRLGGPGRPAIAPLRGLGAPDRFVELPRRAPSRQAATRDVRPRLGAPNSPAAAEPLRSWEMPDQQAAHEARPRLGAPDHRSRRGHDTTRIARAEVLLERSSPLILERRVTEMLSRILHLHVPGVRIYANQPADELAAAAGADALAYPDRIVFRRGAYDPNSPAGLALLGHELTHIARMRAQPPSERLPALGEHMAEEHAALGNERMLLRRFGWANWPAASARLELPDAGGPSLPAPSAPHHWQEAPVVGPRRFPADRSGPAPSLALAQIGGAPRAALSTRELDVPAGPPPVLELPDAQLRRIKEEIYRDLIERIRTEFERGA